MAWHYEFRSPLPYIFAFLNKQRSKHETDEKIVLSRSKKEAFLLPGRNIWCKWVCLTLGWPFRREMHWANSSCYFMRRFIHSLPIFEASISAIWTTFLLHIRQATNWREAWWNWPSISLRYRCTFSEIWAQGMEKGLETSRCRNARALPRNWEEKSKNVSLKSANSRRRNADRSRSAFVSSLLSTLHLQFRWPKVGKRWMNRGTLGVGYLERQIEASISPLQDSFLNELGEPRRRPQVESWADWRDDRVSPL